MTACMYHTWLAARDGRRCTDCKIVQTAGRFDDSVPCRPTDLTPYEVRLLELIPFALTTDVPRSAAPLLVY